MLSAGRLLRVGRGMEVDLTLRCGATIQIRIKIITVGKIHDSTLSAAAEGYLGRLQRYSDASIVPVQGLKITSGRSRGEILRQERARIGEKIKVGEYVIAVDRGGSAFSSEAFADFIEKMTTASHKALAFIIGGPLGLDPDIITKADLSLSLSEMTYAHELCLVMLLEQIYRSFTIIRGEKYHK